MSDAAEHFCPALRARVPTQTSSRPLGARSLAMRPRGGVLAGLCCGLAIWLSGGAPAQAQSSGIYTCIDAQGKRHTADRPIPECLDREQRLLNRDGSSAARCRRG